MGSSSRVSDSANHSWGDGDNSLLILVYTISDFFSAAVLITKKTVPYFSLFLPGWQKNSTRTDR